MVASLVSGCGSAAPTLDTAHATHTGDRSDPGEVESGRSGEPGRSREPAQPTDRTRPSDAAQPSDRTEQPSSTDAARTAGAQDARRASATAVAIQDIPLDPRLITAVRSDPSLQGATDTVFLYLAAWLHGINTGDPSLLTELSTGDCQYCTATVARLVTDPRTVADGFSTQMTATLLAVQEPTSDHDYAVASVGLQVDSAQMTEVDGVQTMQLLEPMTAGLRFAVQSTPSGWAIGGIANEEWDGSV